jgi:hypothetical protein
MRHFCFLRAYGVRMSHPLKFKHRIAVYRGASIHYVAPAAAEHLLDSGLAVVRQKHAKVIAEIELTAAANGLEQGQVGADQLGLRPGSFGIREETLPSGLWCYAHRKPWHEVVPKLSVGVS